MTLSKPTCSAISERMLPVSTETPCRMELPMTTTAMPSGRRARERTLSQRRVSLK